MGHAGHWGGGPIRDQVVNISYLFFFSTNIVWQRVTKRFGLLSYFMTVFIRKQCRVANLIGIFVYLTSSLLHSYILTYWSGKNVLIQSVMRLARISSHVNIVVMMPELSNKA